MLGYGGRRPANKRRRWLIIIIALAAAILIPTVKYWIVPVYKKVKQDKAADLDYFQSSANRVKPTNPVRPPFQRKV